MKRTVFSAKRMIFALLAVLATTLSANAMSYEQARNEALFLTDKMAYELNLTDAQYEAAYEINLDYLMGVTSYDDVYGTYWERRNLDMSYILYQWQWDAFCAASYFYRPLYWHGGYWHFGIYARYPHRDYFYFGRPHFYATYRGGHAWHINGGRSWYHGRADHFRPALANNRQHFGMRNSFDRGDYRNGHNSRSGRSLGSNSSTRVTAGRNDGRGTMGGNRQFGGSRSAMGGSREGNRSVEGNRSTIGGSRSNIGGGAPSASGGSMRSSFGRSEGGSATTTQRSTTTTTTQRSTTTAPTRSFGGSRTSSTTTTTRSSSTTSRPSVSRPSSSVGSSRSSSMGGSRTSSSGGRSGGGSHGHFGGSRR
jgi:hypothetical protein